MPDTAGELLREAYLARREHRLTEARLGMERAVGLCRAADNNAGLARALTGLGQIERDLHNTEAALSHYEEAVALYRAAGNAQRLAHTVRHVADIHRGTGQLELAEPRYAEALTIYREDPQTQPLDLANTLRGVALLKGATGRPAEAIAMWKEARDIYASLGIEEGVAESNRRLAVFTSALTAPVMRSIGVADPATSSTFYRDILGFGVRNHNGAIEASYGPALIRFVEPPYDSTVLFFPTADVRAMRAVILAGGGKPSELQDVNFIKMRVFEIRDPDGHALWFGESYDEPVIPKPSPMMLKALPQLPFDNIAAAVTYYKDVLGFHINHQQDDLGVMDRGEITLVLIPRSHPGSASAYIYVEDADALYAELKTKGASLQGEPVSHPWGLRDFAVLDPEGNSIRFGQPFE